MLIAHQTLISGIIAVAPLINYSRGTIAKITGRSPTQRAIRMHKSPIFIFRALQEPDNC